MNQFYHYNQTPVLPNESTRVMNQNPSLYLPSEGFMRGNMFADTYTPYKNYQPQVLKANNEQEALFLKLAEADFAAHDLNLYLDLHPQDGNAIDLFNDYRSQSNQLRMEYEQKYGPITITSNSLAQSPWLWENMNFPWNEGGR